MAHRPATLVARTAPMRHQWRMVSTVRPARAAASAAVMVVIGIPSLCLYEHHTRVYGVHTIVGGEKPARQTPPPHPNPTPPPPHNPPTDPQKEAATSPPTAHTTPEKKPKKKGEKHQLPPIPWPLTATPMLTLLQHQVQQHTSHPQHHDRQHADKHHDPLRRNRAALRIQHVIGSLTERTQGQREPSTAPRKPTAPASHQTSHRHIQSGRRIRLNPDGQGDRQVNRGPPTIGNETRQQVHLAEPNHAA